jgi:hypothetical protein
MDEYRDTLRGDQLEPLTEDDIARRAFEIWLTDGGSQDENWLQAERELRDEWSRRDVQRRRA